VNSDYGKRYGASDNMGEELNNPSSRFWRMCLDETITYDRKLLKENHGTLDRVLVFGGIFSVVITTLLAQVVQSLSHTDYGQVTALLTLEMLQVQRAMAEGRPTANITATTPSSVVVTETPLSVKWIISMWSVSLTLSLPTALLALLGREWLRSYAAPTWGSAQDRGRVRHSRYMGLMRWRVPEIIQCLPVILHVSLALFFAGFIILLARAGVGVVLVSVIAAIVGSAFLFCVVAPACPCSFLSAHTEHL
ncbi:hypothetical protein BDZ89DRAFT_966710, partial [Hymenopellis radicata]